MDPCVEGKKKPGPTSPPGDRALTIWERYLMQRMRKVESWLRDPYIDSFTTGMGVNLLTEMKSTEKQRSLATRLVQCPLSFPVFPEPWGPPISDEELETYDSAMGRVTRKGPRELVDILIRKLKEQFGSSNEQFVYQLLQNIGLQVLYRWVVERLGFSEESMREIGPKDQLSLMAMFDPGEEDLLKVLVRKFELSDSGVAEEVIAELVRKLALGFAKASRGSVLVLDGSTGHEGPLEMSIPELD